LYVVFLEKGYRLKNIKYKCRGGNNNIMELNNKTNINNMEENINLDAKSIDSVIKTITDDYNKNYLDKFLAEINKSKGAKIISTGFKGLDTVLGGGLFPGLYTIGAISSIGKTTLVLQIADNIAFNGDDVLYFSLEMSRNEIVRKSLSREMFLSEPSKAVTSRDIYRGRYDSTVFNQAFNRYGEISKNIAVIEGSFELGVQQIKDKVKENIKIRGKKPVVIVDYFQILKPFNSHMSDKQANEYNISELKKISREFDIPVVAISSLNRTNYTSVVGFESFKETGAIEYSSDVVIGLQLKGIDEISGLKTETEKRNRINDLKMKYPRDIELITLKQRDGVAFAKQDFRYFSKYNCFVEA
jgi:replicative DNA helicase